MVPEHLTTKQQRVLWKLRKSAPDALQIGSGAFAVAKQTVRSLAHRGLVQLCDAHGSAVDPEMNGLTREAEITAKGVAWCEETRAQELGREPVAFICYEVVRGSRRGACTTRYCACVNCGARVNAYSMPNLPARVHCSCGAKATFIPATGCFVQVSRGRPIEWRPVV